jgi:biotin carboxyl carrier protein
MKFEVQLTGPSGKKVRIVELDRNGAGWRVLVDGQLVVADVVKITPNIISVLLHGQSYEIRVTPSLDGKLKLQTGTQEFTAEVVDQRAWSGRRHGHLEAEGRQQVVAPMPGKVVRLLIKAGDRVEAGQGLLVVEAMKMQNEIRSPKSGTVERVLTSEGQPVNAGQILAWID